MMGQHFAASKEDFEYSMQFAIPVEKLVQECKLRGHPVELRDGDLDAFLQAIEDLENKKVSGRKLVVRTSLP